MGLLWFLASRFVAGESLEDAIPKVKILNSLGLRTTMDILGENVTNKSEPERFLDGYLKVLESAHKENIMGGISIKPTMMGMGLDDELCFKNITKILEEAAKYKKFVRIDMEGTKYTEQTISLFLKLFENHKNTGIVIQAYLHRSEEDIKRINKAGATVRLCKGAYKEPKELAFQNMADIRENYKKLLKLLFKEGKYPAIATHDEKLINWVKEWIQQEGISKDIFEFQMLYGIQSKLQKSLIGEGYKVRVYVPFGTHWFPYFYRRLRERKENVFFVLRNLLKN